MKNLSLFVFLFISLFLISCGGSKTAQNTNKKKPAGVVFDDSETLTSVLEQAEAKNKLVFVDFYATWCVPCKMMDEDVFTDKTIADFMNKHFINYKVDGEKGNGVNLAFVFQVQAYPTLLFLNTKGEVLEKKVGAAYHTELMQMANSALAKKN